MLCTSLDGKPEVDLLARSLVVGEGIGVHGENGCATTDIENNLIFE